MTFKKEHINVVWFKRDLRLEDNEAIQKALKASNRTILLYVFEPLLVSNPHYSKRHWNFIKESIADINKSLKAYNTKVLCVQSDIISVFNQIQNHFKIDAVFSHRETGIAVTYDRDKTFKRYCKNNLIKWDENDNNSVLRGLKNRNEWFDKWNEYMSQNIIRFKPNENSFLKLSEIEELEEFLKTTSLNTTNKKEFQHGGTTMAWKYANSFFLERHVNYMFNISKPYESRFSCSRLSPYIAWGNVSVRQVYQAAIKHSDSSNNKKQIGAFVSRLRWQAHFIQKFEMEDIMENVSINKGYRRLKKRVSEKYQKAWKDGQTGFPLVDASMRCLTETGYLNFRMRALVVSFFTHILWQPWQDASKHLSQMFLDFEPGIHFPQLQMQAGETGINNLRIYNPTKNSIEHDRDALFIKKWVPELAHLELPFIHNPQLLTPLESQLYNFKLGEDYPYPIVELNTRRKRASDVLWSLKKDKTVLRDNERILAKHTLKDRAKMLKNNL